MQVQIKKLHPDAVIPKYQTEGASGFDLCCLEDYQIYPGETKLIKTGIAFSIPNGYEMQIRPRSGLSLKTNFRITNSPGTIDSDFVGEVCIIGMNADFSGKELIVFNKGDRIAQGVVCPIIQVNFEEVTELKNTERSDKGFGSSGTQG